MIFGIDISKDLFDVYNTDLGHNQFENTDKGIRSFIKDLPQNAVCVMEATGNYHNKLALGLFEQEIGLSVVNPLVIKRYSQMKLRRFKTDKSDAFMIYCYGCEQELELWNPEPEYIAQGKEIISLLQMYSKQSTSLKNKLHALENLCKKRTKVITSIKRQLRNLTKESKSLETELLKLIKESESLMFTRIKTIPGIGDKTAILLMLTTNCFKDFESYKQVSSYLGLAPNERSSGSSIRGRSRISKTGDGLVRNHLFMCSFTACIHNAQCKALFDRIVAKGKSKKLALIAVCNKLIKQAFAIAKSGLSYDPKYV